MQLSDGERALAHERYFIIRSAGQDIDKAGWTPLERDSFIEHRWWSLAALLADRPPVFPQELFQILTDLLASGAVAH
jgi:hypothetical protein